MFLGLEPTIPGRHAVTRSQRAEVLKSDFSSAHHTKKTRMSSNSTTPSSPPAPKLARQLSQDGGDAQNSSSGALKITVYSPDSAILKPRQLVVEMFRDAWAGRELAWRLFIRNTRAAHRQSILGYLWMLLPPIVTTALFTFLHSKKILNVGTTDIPYPAYILTGTILWNGFVGAINAPIGAIQGAASMLTKLNFPREALLLTAAYHLLLNTAINLTLLLAVYCLFDVSVTWAVLAAPAAIMGLLVFGFTLGLLLVPAAMLYQDVQQSVAVLTRLWYFATPIIYPATISPATELLSKINPVCPFLVTARDLLTTGSTAHVPSFLIASCVTLPVFFLAWAAFRLLTPHIVARMCA